jgi:hypothetical protein
MPLLNSVMPQVSIPHTPLRTLRRCVAAACLTFFWAGAAAG